MRDINRQKIAYRNYTDTKSDLFKTICVYVCVLNWSLKSKKSSSRLTCQACLFHFVLRFDSVFMFNPRRADARRRTRLPKSVNKSQQNCFGHFSTNRHITREPEELQRKSALDRKVALLTLFRSGVLRSDLTQDQRFGLQRGKTQFSRKSFFCIHF